jgi:hypothetical protein
MQEAIIETMVVPVCVILFSLFVLFLPKRTSWSQSLEDASRIVLRITASASSF